MKLQVCDVCKRMFQTISNNKVCQRCMLNNEEAFKKVKEYLRENPGTSMPILAEEIGISISAVEQYLRQERLEVAPGSPVMLACNKCNAEIVTGMYCESCGRTMIAEFKKIKNTLEAKEKEEEGKLKYVTAKWRT